MSGQRCFYEDVWGSQGCCRSGLGCIDKAVGGAQAVTTCSVPNPSQGKKGPCKMLNSMTKPTKEEHPKKKKKISGQAKSQSPSNMLPV